MNGGVPSTSADIPEAFGERRILEAVGSAATAGPDTSVENSLRYAVAARLTLIGIGIIAFLYLARVVVLPLVVAWVFAMALKPPMRWLTNGGLPAPLAALTVMAALLVPVAIGVSQFAGPLVAWFDEAPANVRQLKQRLVPMLRRAERLSEAAASAGRMNNSTAIQQAPVEVADHQLATTAFSWTGTMLVGVGETVALLFLLLAAGDSFRQKLVRVLPTFRDKRRAVDISREIQQGISTYLFSAGLINLSFGALVAFALALVGMPQPGMWGLIAALLNFIPYFGPLVGLGLVGVAGLLAFPTPGQGLVPAACYLGLHLLEANVVTPLIIGRRMTLNPVVVFVSLIFFVWLWGMPGAFVAVPLLVSLRVLCDRMPSLGPVAEFISS